MECLVLCMICADGAVGLDGCCSLNNFLYTNNVNIYLHTYIRIYIHTYIHTYIDLDMVNQGDCQDLQFTERFNLINLIIK